MRYEENMNSMVEVKMTDNQIKAKFIHYAAGFLDDMSILDYDDELADLYDSSEEEQDRMYNLLVEAEELIHKLATQCSSN